MAEPAAVAVAGRRVGRPIEYARYRDRSKAWVSNLKAAGKLKAPAILPDGAIDFDLADEMLAQTLDSVMSRKGTASAPTGGSRETLPLGLDDGRRRKANADAQLAEMELERRRGQLVDRASVETAGRELGILCQQVLEAHGRRVVDAVRAAPNAAQALNAWQAEARSILVQIGHEAQRSIDRLHRDEVDA